MAFERKLNLHLIPGIVSIALLFIAATVDADGGFYNLVRLVICASSVLFAITAPPSMFHLERYVFIFIAVLFNPLFKVTFDERETWQMFDAMAAVVFVYAVLRFWVSTYRTQSQTPSSD